MPTRYFLFFQSSKNDHKVYFKMQHFYLHLRCLTFTNTLKIVQSLGPMLFHVSKCPKREVIQYKESLRDGVNLYFPNPHCDIFPLVIGTLKMHSLFFSPPFLSYFQFHHQNRYFHFLPSLQHYPVSFQIFFSTECLS